MKLMVTGIKLMVLPGSSFPWEGQPCGWMGWFAVVALLPRRLPWEGSTTSCYHLITMGDHQQSIQRLFATVVRVSFGIASSSIHSFSWSQLTSQQHLPSASSLIRVQSQLSFSFSISLPPFPLLFLLYFSFSLPISDVAFVQGLKIKQGVLSSLIGWKFHAGIRGGT